MTAPSPDNPLDLSPVRIYVLWHPQFDRPDFKQRDPQSLAPEESVKIDRGINLARRIYHWFRLENMEGIPVYFRCLNAPGRKQPRRIDPVSGVNYIIPLVNADMVASPEWRGYVTDLMSRPSSPDGDDRNVLLPVAVNPVAYNMPADVRKLNFIRHDMSGTELPDPVALLSRLTEVICRDLRAFLYKKKLKDDKKLPPPGKLKIFLSHAKADGTEEALAIKDYLYRNTQCEAFFDETDIASGYDFQNILESAIERESAGLFVIQGDHYADRPWCRKEIRDFLAPVADALGRRSNVPAFFLPPAVIVQTMRGNRVARSIPELGHSPCVRWKDDTSARFMVTTLFREILLGMFYRLISRGLARGRQGKNQVFINRTPDPVMVERILGLLPQKQKPDTFVHPGYGLSAMDRECLRIAFSDLNFVSFSQLASTSDPDVGDLGDRVIAVSAGNSPDILRLGAGDEHNQELVKRLMRPLFHANASILYGGALPYAIQNAEPWEKPVNFVATFLELLLSERDSSTKAESSKARLYNLCAWPYSDGVTPLVRAQWTGICHFIPIGSEIAGLGALPQEPKDLAESELEGLSPSRRALARNNRADEKREYTNRRKLVEALCLSAMRRMAARKDSIGPIPPDRSDGDQPPPGYNTAMAHIYIGGKVKGATGIMPGIFEEALYAFESRKPVFIIKLTAGAAGLLGGWLAAETLEQRPPELTVEHYLDDPIFAENRRRLLELTKENRPDPQTFVTPDEGFDRLWSEMQRARREGLGRFMNNALDDTQNLSLLNATRFTEVCKLVWEGIAGIAKRPKEDAQP